MPYIVPDLDEIRPAERERKLPVYLLLDISCSMKGAPIELVRSGLGSFWGEVSSDPFAREVVKLGVITFGVDVEILTDGLVSIAAFQAMKINSSDNNVRRLDLAFQLLRQSIDRDIKRSVLGGPKGDWKPVVVILLVGHPTNERGNLNDNWKSEFDQLINRPIGQLKPSTVIVLDCGSDVDVFTAEDIQTGTLFHMGAGLSQLLSHLKFITQSLPIE